jgi:hypothetical protein
MSDQKGEPNKPRFQTFISCVAATQHANPDWRRGQTVFNVLCEEDPEYAEEIRGTKKDCFYFDDRIPMVFEALQQRWDS